MEWRNPDSSADFAMLKFSMIGELSFYVPLSDVSQKAIFSIVAQTLDSKPATIDDSRCYIAITSLNGANYEARVLFASETAENPSFLVLPEILGFSNLSGARGNGFYFTIARRDRWDLLKVFSGAPALHDLEDKDDKITHGLLAVQRRGDQFRRCAGVIRDKSLAFSDWTEWEERPSNMPRTFVTTCRSGSN